MAQSSAADILSFLNIVGNLKKTLRTGWKMHKTIENVETVAEHMHRMSIMAMICPDPNLNREKLVKMSIVHDLAEAVTGDITPHKSVNDALGVKHMEDNDKFKKEKEVMENLRDLLRGNPHSQEMVDLLVEYNEGKTAEALFCKDIDKLEMIIQADEYERAYPGTDLTRFYQSTEGKFKHPFIQGLDKQLREARNARLAGSSSKP